MAFLLLKDSVKQRLQGLSDLSCSSAASASVVVASCRAIDRHSPRIRDPHQRLPPSVPKPPLKQKQPNSFSSSGKDSCSSSSIKQQQQQLLHHNNGGNNNRYTAVARSSTSEKKKKKTLQHESPASSSRFLLNSSRLLQHDADVMTLQAPVPVVDDMFLGRGGATLPVPWHLEALPTPVRLAEWSAGSGSSYSSSSWSPSQTGNAVASASAAARDDGKAAIMRSCSTRTREHQVVVLRVSLHCRGCASKVKKHISKMEGVTSFDIDIATKKVTVVGDVTPLGVLNSISKVKNAQFWPDCSSSSPPRASASF